MFHCKAIEELIAKEDNAPPQVASRLASMVVGDDGSSTSSSDANVGPNFNQLSSSSEESVEIEEPKMPAKRRRFPKRDPFKSNH